MQMTENEAIDKWLELYRNNMEKQGGERMARITGKNGGTTIERRIFFESNESKYQNIQVSVHCDGEPNPDEVKQIAKIVENARDEIEKIIGEW